MFERLLKLRYVAVIVVILAFLHALAFLFMGAQIAVKTYWHILHGAGVGGPERPGVELLHSLDLMLVALVLMILSLGVAKLFVLEPSAVHGHHYSLPSWLQIETFTELKILLWETILTALLVISLATLTANLFGKPNWSALVIPTGIFLLALSLYFMKKS